MADYDKLLQTTYALYSKELFAELERSIRVQNMLFYGTPYLPWTKLLPPPRPPHQVRLGRWLKRQLWERPLEALRARLCDECECDEW